MEETVSEEEGKKFAEEINAVFKRTSALSDSDTGISDLFDELVDKYLNDQNKGENNNNKDENIKIKKEVPSAKPKEKRC